MEFDIQQEQEGLALAIRDDEQGECLFVLSTVDAYDLMRMLDANIDEAQKPWLKKAYDG